MQGRVGRKKYEINSEILGIKSYGWWLVPNNRKISSKKF